MPEPILDSPPAGGSPNPSDDPGKKGQPNAGGSEEYTKERHDGLMSSWQKDKTALDAANKKVKELEEGGGDEKKEVDKKNQKEWVNYLRGEIKEAEKTEKTERNKKVKDELAELKESHPEFTEKEILEAAIEYSKDEETPISLKATVKILKKIKDRGKTEEEVAEAEKKKKESAGGTGGREGTSDEEGLKPFDPEKDKGKSPQELMQDGKKELGIK